MANKSIFEFTAVLAIALLAGAMGQAAPQREKLSRQQLKSLISSAKTPADHQRLAAHYRDEAERLKAKQREHEEEAEEYYKDPFRHPGPKYPTLGQHCRDLAGFYGVAAQKALTMADLHERLAQEAK